MANYDPDPEQTNRHKVSEQSDDSNGDPNLRRGKKVQVFTSMFINILALGTGASYGIPNVFLSQLDPKECNTNGTLINNKNYSGPPRPPSPPPLSGTSIALETDPPVNSCPFTINSDQKSWIATSSILGMYCTLFFAVSTVSKFGKRVSLMIDCILSFIGFILMAIAVNVPMLYLAKFLLGYVSLTSRSAIQPFICEISNPAIRGLTTSLYVLCYISGQALSVLVANHFENGWRYVSGAFGVFMIICFLVLLLWIHESPDWLLEKCLFKKATKSLEFYEIDRKILVDDDQKRKTKDGYEKSYEEIVSLYEQESRDTTTSEKMCPKTWPTKIRNTVSATISTFKRPEVYKPFVFLSIMLGLVDLSGFVVMANYSIVLVKEYGYEEHKTFVNASDLMVIIYLSRIPSSFLAIPLLQKNKKRPVYLVVSFCLLLIIIGIITFTSYEQKITKQEFQQSIGLQMCPLILFILFYATFSFGYGNVPFSLMGELFPPNASSMANTCVFILSNIFGFVAVNTALVINDTYGLQYVFFIPAGAVVASMLVAGIFMPETYGMSLDEIRNIYSKKLDEIPEKLDEVPEKLPYYHELRSKLTLESTRMMKQRQSVYAWPAECAQGIVQLPDAPDQKVTKSDTLADTKKKLSSMRHTSLPVSF